MARHAKKQSSGRWGKRILGLLIFIVLVVLIFAVLELVSSMNASRWDRMSNEDGRYIYTVNDKMASLTGIDVSDHDEYIDWDAVANDGIDFAFVRIGRRGYTEGGLFVDERFEQNYAGAREAGLAVGVYFFSQATSEEEAIAEADYILGLLQNRELDLPIVFDWETVSDAHARTSGMTKNMLTPYAVAFCKRILSAGYQPMIYMNLKDSERYDMARLSDYPIWFAQYGVDHPTVDIENLSVWQYSASGRVNGLSGSADMNILFLDASRPIYQDGKSGT